MTVVDKQPISCLSQPLCVMLRHSHGLKLPVEVLTDISPAASVVSELAVLVTIMIARPTSIATIRKKAKFITHRSRGHMIHPGPYSEVMRREGESTWDSAF